MKRFKPSEKIAFPVTLKIPADKAKLVDGFYLYTVLDGEKTADIIRGATILNVKEVEL